MTTLLLLSVLLAPEAPITFDRDGVRVSGELVRGAALELRNVEGGVVLASSSLVEPLSGALVIETAGRTLVVEPGVRASRLDGAVRLSSHGKTLSLVSGDTTVAAGTDVTVRAIETGWDLGNGKTLAGTELRVGLQDDPPAAAKPAQDDSTDDDLDAMRRAARRIQTRRRTQARVELRIRRIFAGDPTAPGWAVERHVLRELTIFSPIGF